MPAGIRFSSRVFKKTLKKKHAKDKIRVGIIIGKPHDPIKKQQARRLAKGWPEHLKVKNNTGANAASGVASTRTMWV